VCYSLWYNAPTVKKISDNEIYLLIKYIKNVLWGVAKRLSYIEDARCLKVNVFRSHLVDTLTLFLYSLEVQGSNLNSDCFNCRVFSNLTGN